MPLNRKTLAPLILLVIVLGLGAASELGWLPTGEIIIDVVNRLQQDYGLPIVAVLSFIENLAGVSVYFPGSIVILVTMASTAGQPILGVQTFLAIYCGAFASYFVNYRAGLRLNASPEPNCDVSNVVVESPVLAGSIMWRAISFAHPHFAGLTCLRLGLDGAKVYHWLAYCGICGTFWNLFWGLLMYNYGGLARASGSEGIWLLLVVIYLLIWLGYEWYQALRQDRNQAGQDV